MQTYALLAALTLLGPFALFKWYGRETVLERTKAKIAFISLLGPSRLSTDYDIFNVFLPGNRSMILELETARADRFKSNPFVEAHITISKSAFGAPYISAVQLPGESANSAGEPRNGGLYLSIVYMMLGWAATAFVVQPDVYADLGRAGMLFAGLLIALSGYVFAVYSMKPLPADARVDMLGGLIKLGNGRPSLILATLIACALTAMCYWYGGFGLFLGLNVGCAAGMLVGLLCKPVLAPQKPVLN